MHNKIITEICKYQPLYSSNNTPEMKVRGKFIRDTFSELLKGYLPEISKAMGLDISDLAIEGKGGMFTHG